MNWQSIGPAPDPKRHVPGGESFLPRATLDPRVRSGDGRCHDPGRTSAVSPDTFRTVWPAMIHHGFFGPTRDDLGTTFTLKHPMQTRPAFGPPDHFPPGCFSPSRFISASCSEIALSSDSSMVWQHAIAAFASTLSSVQQLHRVA